MTMLPDADDPGRRAPDFSATKRIAQREPWAAVEADAAAARHAASAKPLAEAVATAELRLAFAPIHKRAFGIAVGTATGLLVFGLTLFHLVLDPQRPPNLGLLRNYFYGYSVSPAGLAVGTFWGFVVGFVGGWFVAFCRNMVIAISVFVTRTRAELAQTRDFLDHI